MRLEFLNRSAELIRLRRALGSRTSALVCIYGRRRLGKSRLLQESLPKRSVYYVGDQRDAPLQREALARAIADVLPRFGDVVYSEWEPLLERWWQEAKPGAVLALDEFPALAAASPELPSLLQKYVDRRTRHARHVVLCGSSQRMMQGLVLDSTAPLYGRAREILRVTALGPHFVQRALHSPSPERAIEHYAVWGGVPRYWELAADFRSRSAAVEALVLDPLGVLHAEPERLLLDDLTEVARAASILTLVGRGCHRVSEIAGRLAVPATSLSRPLARLTDLGLLIRELPFGASPRDSKRSLYRLGEPFLRFWFRFVEPHRSQLEAGLVKDVAREIESAWPQFLGEAWEDLARASVPRLRIEGVRWGEAARWWGAGTDRKPLELDIVALSRTGRRALVGEAKRTCTAAELPSILSSLENKALRCPLLAGRQLSLAVWALEWRTRTPRRVIRASSVLRALT